MKIIRKIKNINSGRIWVIPIESFLFKTDFKSYSDPFKENGIKTINDIFKIFKQDGLKNLITELGIPKEKQETLLSYLNKELTFIDKVEKYRKVIFLSFLGIISLLLPFVTTENENEFSKEILQKWFFQPIFKWKLFLTFFYSFIILVSLKFYKNILLLKILIFSLSVILVFQFYYIFWIFDGDTKLLELNTSINPSIGLFSGIVINLILLNKLSLTKKMIKSEKPININLEY